MLRMLIKLKLRRSHMSSTRHDLPPVFMARDTTVVQCYTIGVTFTTDCNHLKFQLLVYKEYRFTSVKHLVVE